MKVVLWCQGLMDDTPRPRFAYDDRTSTTRQAAAERAFTIVNGSIHHLDEVDLELRRRFRALNPGVGLGVGDFVEVNGVKLRCTERDFSPVTDDPGRLEPDQVELLLETSAIPDDQLAVTDYSIHWPQL